MLEDGDSPALTAEFDAVGAELGRLRDSHDARVVELEAHLADVGACEAPDPDASTLNVRAHVQALQAQLEALTSEELALKAQTDGNAADIADVNAAIAAHTKRRNEVCVD